ncbi:MAG: NAD(P)-dependent oxidoreductase [Pseudomonadota bacterium]|nr:NAD(P)-dependent oxidoreductase [Pseudomonadota bacterium]
MTLALGLIGYGEVGQLFAREWVAGGGATVAVYDVKCDDPLQREPLAKTAAEDKVQLAGSPATAIAGAEIVISAVTADQAVDAARAAAGHLREGQVYVDLNSVSPHTKRLVAEALGGRDFVEFAVMSPVAGLGLASPILAGGARCEDVAGRLNPLGMRIETVGHEIGVASATKLCRSLVIKGLEAIMVDLGQAADRAGVLAGVLKSLAASYPGMEWEELVRSMPKRVARHGVRRAAEMREAARMFEELGVSGALAQAIADRHETYAAEVRNS